MTELEKEKPLTWFVIVNLALLFISGCWMAKSLMVTSWKSSLGFARPCY
ncbi:MAG: hypothetical protein OEY40_05215 [Candidatus Bathyarchaeota archaeon]|nr:hypothetical protein [Candidatus Bathyarchaeota archaeon]